jgi:diketogulonate reductase-like aldo/keto reductase
MELDLRSTLTLRNGVEIPRLGLGVYQARRGSETRAAVEAALAAGYRHVDTAAAYGNERDVGEALRTSGVPRDQVFVTTKLWNSDHGHEQALRACQLSLDRLGLEYVDLYLVHWPVPSLRGESWRALEELLERQRCRAIGVSNYTVRHLDELAREAQVLPMVNQVELHPYLPQADVRAWCGQHGVRVEAYSPLTRGERLGDARLVEIAKRVGRTPAQVLIRWALQHDLVVIPKSTQAARIRENAAVFDFVLGAADMAILDGLDENLHTCWDPTHAP